MKSLIAKFVLSTFVVVAMLTSPASAKKPQQDTRNQASSVYASPVYSAIPGYYDSEGNVVAIPDPDQSGSSQRQ
jgi:hypothetical protein